MSGFADSVAAIIAAMQQTTADDKDARRAMAAEAYERAHAARAAQLGHSAYRPGVAYNSCLDMLRRGA